MRVTEDGVCGGGVMGGGGSGRKEAVAFSTATDKGLFLSVTWRSAPYRVTEHHREV